MATTETRSEGPAAPATRGVIWFAHVIRGLAALVIIWGHLVVEFQEQDLVARVAFTEPLADVPSNFTLDIFYFFHDHLSINLGNAAVAVFFMVSGFVIPFSLERRTLAGFGIRRFLRFYPTLWVAIGLSLFFVWLQTRGEPPPYRGGEVVGSMSLFSQYAGVRWIDPSYWTLPIEELFYVSAAVCAVTGWLVRRSAIVLWAAGLGAMSTVLGRQTPASIENPPDWVYWTRLWLGRNAAFVIFVFVGVALHHLYRGFWTRRDFVLVTAALVGIFLVAMRHGPFQQPYQPVDQANIYFNSYVAGLAVFVTAYWLGDRIPKRRCLDELAEMSYPIYLLNTVCGWVILVALTRYFDSYFVALGVTVVIVLVMAYLLHRLVEVPSMTLARKISGRPRFRTDRGYSAPPPAGPEPAPEPPATPPVAIEGP